MYVLEGRGARILDAVVIYTEMLTPVLECFSHEEKGQDSVNSRGGLQNPVGTKCFEGNRTSFTLLTEKQLIPLCCRLLSIT